jgi:hypothetical protein
MIFHSSLAAINSNIYSDSVTVRSKPTASDPSKHTNKQPAIIQTVSPTITAATPPLTEVIGSTVLSTTDAWDSSRRVTEFLEGLKNREVDREGIPSSFYYL